MVHLGERANLKILQERSHGLILDGDELGEILLPRREMPPTFSIGALIDVFLYTDSEDRPVATLKKPLVMHGQFARLRCVALSDVGAFFDWGLQKDLLCPFREQKKPLEVGKSYVVYVFLDPYSQRLIATTRIARHMDLTEPDFKPGQEVDLIAFGKTDLGYKAIINGTHSGLLFANEVFHPLQPGEQVKGYIADIRPDGKITLSLHAPGRTKVDHLEEQILAELAARGGFWDLGDHSSAEEIHSELSVSKRTFKQATGALLRKRKITIEKNGIRLAD